MNFVNTLAPWQWAVLGLVPPAIILLYFLKLKRQPLVVPSTYLWRRTLEDLHVNSLWQRLRSNLLLLLQLLIIFLLMGALLRPGRRGPQLLGHRFIFLIDVSASSQATDVSPSRLEAGKRQVADMIDQMESGDSAMVVQFSDRAEIVQNYTQQKRLLKKRVRALRPTARGSSLQEALRVASGLANPSSARGEGAEQSEEALPATVYVVSDGAVPEVGDFDVGNLTLRHVPLGSPKARNVAITAFSADRNPDHPGQLDLFARLENFSSQEVTVQIGLRYGETPAEAVDTRRPYLDVKEVRIPARGTSGEGFRMEDVQEGVFVLEIDLHDDLELDNRAFLAINRPERARVLLVTPGDTPIETALETRAARRLAQVEVADPKVLKQESYQQKADAGVYDLIIYDRCSPPSMPLANTLFWGALPPDGRWSFGPKESLPVVIDVDRSHPICQFLNFDDVLAFLEGHAVKGPEGARSLISGSIGDLLVLAPREGYEDAVLGLPLYRQSEQGDKLPNTDWPRRTSFPVFLLNVVRYLGRVQFYSAAPNVAPGQVVRIRASTDARQLTIVDPRGRRHKVERSRENVFVFADTEALGTYLVEDTEGEVVRRFTVNLFAPRESDIVPRPIEVGADRVEPARVRDLRRWEYWKWILLLALVILALEWYIYNRRVWI